jgi:hypothetical protein
MAEWRITMEQIMAFNPCSAPMVGNKFYNEETKEFVLPNGWTDDVIAYYLADRGEASLLWWVGLRWADGSRVIPINGKQAWAAIASAREAKKRPRSPAVLVPPA